MTIELLGVRYHAHLEVINGQWHCEADGPWRVDPTPWLYKSVGYARSAVPLRIFLYFAIHQGQHQSQLKKRSDRGSALLKHGRRWWFREQKSHPYCQKWTSYRSVISWNEVESPGQKQIELSRCTDLEVEVRPSADSILRTVHFVTRHLWDIWSQTKAFCR